MKKKTASKTISNKRARFDYQIKDDLVAGIVLTGAEAKSLRYGHAILRGSFCVVKDGELCLTNLQINPLITNAAHMPENDRTRARKLLVTAKQLKQIEEAKKQGKSVVPIRLLTQTRHIKVELGIGRGKKKYDKRQDIKKRDLERNLKRGIIE